MLLTKVKEEGLRSPYIIFCYDIRNSTLVSGFKIKLNFNFTQVNYLNGPPHSHSIRHI